MEDHPKFSQKGKAQILLEWYAFVRSGFEKQMYGAALHQFLSEFGPANLFGRNIDRENFWQIYFDSKIGMVWAVVQQFSLRDILGEGQDLDWWDRYESPVFGDLMQVMVEVMNRLGGDFQDMIEGYEMECMQTEIDKKIADFEAALPASSTQSRETIYQAIYEAAQIRATVGSYPVTPELRRRLAKAAQSAVRPITQPPLSARRQRPTATPLANLGQVKPNRPNSAGPSQQKRKRSNHDNG